MKDINQKYYEPLEQMMAIRHQYMAKIVKLTHELSIYKFFSKSLSYFLLQLLIYSIKDFKPLL